MNQRSASIDNPDIVPFALYRLGGVGNFIDVEEIFELCYKLAPERFGWRKFKYPNYKILSKALRDYEGKYPNHLLKTSDGLGRQISSEGLDWLKKRLPIIAKALQVPGSSPPTKRPLQKMLNEMASNPIVQKVLAGERPELKKHIVADLLLCSPDSPVAVFKERLETYRAAAVEGGRKDVLEFLEFLYDNYKSYFGG